jgi:DNA-binding transcriptional LysR family regulator
LILQEATSMRILQWIEDDKLDIGLVRTPLLRTSVASLVSLSEDVYIAALPRSNPLCGKERLELGDLADQCFIMYAGGDGRALRSTAMLACQQAGFLPIITQEAVQIQTVLALVDSGLGVALVPSIVQRFVSDNIVYRSFATPPPAAAIGLALAYRADRESAAASRFRMLASKEVPL